MFFDHLNISAPNPLLNKEKDFWCEILSLKVGYRPTFNNNGFWLYSNDTDKAVIHLTESDVHKPCEFKHCLDHVAFKVINTSRIVQMLNSHNVPYKIKKIIELNLVQLFFTTPAGIIVEINGEDS